MLNRLILMLSLLTMFAFVACDDDDDNNSTSQCGNGVLEGTEECDDTALGGNDCTTIGGTYTGGTLACNTNCTFDVSMCEGGSELCGNGAIDEGESCDGTNLGGLDCTGAGAFTGGTLSCTDGCAFDTTLCELSEDCGNGVIDGTESCDGTELGGNSCADVGDFTGGTLGCTDGCAFDTSLCENVGLTTSEQIAAARAAADATGLSLAIDNALVTYTKAAFGSDVAGFFVQADQTGPALFVAVDPATTSPVLSAGDQISFVIEEMGTVGDMRQALAITSLTRASTGNDVSPLIQDVNAATDLVSAVSDYECELVAATLNIRTDFVSAGTGFIAAEVDTTGVSADSNLRLRIPNNIMGALDLTNGCVVELLGTPMWRYYSAAQLSVWDAADVNVVSCLAPTVAGAIAASTTSVVVSFDRNLSAGSVLPNGSQFTIAGLTVSAAAVSGSRQVTLTTSTQAAGTTYDVVVADTVQDIYGSGVDAAANSASFIGYSVPAVVVINELNATITGGCDLIELRVVEGGSMEGFTLMERTGNLVVFSGLSVATNDIIVVHMNGNNATCNPASATDETVGPAENPNSSVSTNYDTAYDWYATDNGLTDTDNVFSLWDGLGALVDAVLVADSTSGNAAGGSEDEALLVVAEGGWTNTDGTVPAGGYIDDDFRINAVQDLDATATTSDGTSIQRNGDVDNNHMGDWTMAMPSWGILNASQSAF